MTNPKRPVVGHDRPAAEKKRDREAGKKPDGKGLSAHNGPTDENKALNQRRYKTDGLTSNQNFGKNADLNYADEVGKNRHPELKKPNLNK